MRIYLIILSTLLLLTGCRHTATDPAIRQAELLADSLPRQALSIIDSIPVSTLSGHDRFLHNYLRIKTEDKLFITHRNDSLLRLVLDYAKSNRRSVDYPELLYYAGRVYSDMGDYPTALENYYKALEEIPEDKDIKLRAKILSNIGYIHTATCLYDKGIEAFSEAIKLDSICGDTLNMMYDLISMGNLYYNKEDYDAAENLTKYVMGFSANRYPDIYAEQHVRLANIKLYKHEYDSALTLLGNNVNRVDSIMHNRAMSIAADVFYYAGEMDSAYIYANKVIGSNDIRYMPRAYTLLLSDGLINRIPHDSVNRYVKKYTSIVNKTLERNSKKEILIKESQYDYSIQQQKRLDAEIRVSKIKTLLMITTFIIFAILLILAWMRVKSHRNKMLIMEYRRDIAHLKDELANYTRRNTATDEDSIKHIKDELLNRISLFDSKSAPNDSKDIKKTEVYNQLVEHLNSKTILTPENNMWGELLNEIQKSSPNFKESIEALLQRKLRPMELCIVLLIKCDFTPSDVSTLLGRVKGTISSTRMNLGKEIFKEKVSTSKVDALIKNL